MGYDCPLCAIAAGKDTEPPYTRQSEVVLRNDQTTAFVNSNWWPENPGAVVVIPNRHYENIWDLPAAEAAHIHEAARAVAASFKKAYGCDGVSTRQHNEPAGNQEVWHYHLHVFPRYEGDRLYERHAERRLASIEERDRHAAMLREALESLRA